MNDDDLKHEIEEALAVDPPPQFASRVRARIAAGSRPARVRWSVAGAGVTLAAVVIAAVLFRPGETVGPLPAPVSREIASQETLPPPLAPKLQDKPVKTARAPKASAPEVLIDPRSVAAFHKFVEGVQKNRIDVGTLIELQRRTAESLTIEDIALMPLGALEPIVIEPLPSVRRIEGGSL
jgi:hypothetical protein